MSELIIWQVDSNNPQKAVYFTQIEQWWQDLNLKEVSWQQRLIPETGQINWEPQRFDENLTLVSPQIRGITLYWHKLTFEDERSITPQKLILDPVAETLDIYPQSQSNLAIRISKLGIIYQKFELTDPLIVSKNTEDGTILLLRDKQQQLEIKINLSQNSLKQLLDNLQAD
ncbi:hypothetical protein C7H19_14440 [Aphanothece hegewaldii CCALA 016]|uniref:Uncharacterized protein n=1 Tax=Aphanothece hegewaldii CCALA 016 TaxID=2107694 RepID=A0A2T1LWB2_9CHRO|nr:hypothetical protein [Aphanothece hegewaldii]PSF36191.1 hypothetical protein C7H19_14440 [Aphanothece hegewaldii CCALA 016]